MIRGVIGCVARMCVMPGANTLDFLMQNEGLVL